MEISHRQCRRALARTLLALSGVLWIAVLAPIAGEQQAWPDKRVRLFWGSDWPFAAFESKLCYQDTIDGLAAWISDPEARRRIGGETALQFYFC